MTSGVMQRRSLLVSVGLTLFFLVLACRLVGIDDGDDTWYQTKGATLRPYDFVTEHYWSPLYQLWFRAFAVVWHNPVWCYFACWVALVLLFALIPAVFAIRYAWIYAMIFMVFPFALLTPYSGMFGGTLAVLALCLVLRSRPTFSQALAASCGMSFVLSMCRSEFDTAELLSAAATLVALALEWKSLSAARRGGERRRMVTIALVVVLMSAGTVFILTHAHGQRSGMAFAQHFNQRAAMRGNIPMRGFPVSNFAEQSFGIDLAHNAGNGAAGMKDFFVANPKLFLKHVAYNVFDPKTVLILMLVLFALLYPWTLRSARGLRPASLFMAVFLIPAFMDLCLVFPRDHYIMLLLPCVTLFVLQAIPLDGLLQPPVWVLGVGMAAMYYINMVIPLLTLQPPNEARVYLQRINCVRQVDATIPASNPLAFDSQLIRDVYLVHPRTQLSDYDLEKWDGFKAWAVKNHPAWITSDDAVASWYGVTPAQLDTFLQGELGYVPHVCSPLASMTMYAPKVP